MNNMMKKLIEDSRRNARIRQNLLGIKIGAVLLLFGFLFLAAAFLMSNTAGIYLLFAFKVFLLLGFTVFFTAAVKSLMERLFGK